FGQRLTLTTLGHCERPPTRAPLAPLARPESVDVHSAQVSLDLAALGFKQRLTLASLGSPKTPAASDLARSAREALVGVRFCDLAVVNALLLGPRSLRSRDPRRRSLTTAKSLVHCCPRNNCAPPTAQDESGGSDSSENGSESAQLYPELQLLR
ncbi:hypothetical protein TYRP_017546, partial [Tyrophagus putrescentiae]